MKLMGIVAIFFLIAFSLARKTRYDLGALEAVLTIYFFSKKLDNVFEI